MAKTAAGGKNRKYGRHKKWCEAYRNSNRRLKNKIAKIKRHIQHFPKDNQAWNKLRSLTRT